MLPLVSAIQKHVAVVAIGPSTVRGQGASGVVAAAQGYLASLALDEFGVREKAEFDRSLETATAKLVTSFPKQARSWGLARKCLNIFLRDAFYNAFLAPKYGLSASESFYEVPLDGVVAKELRRHAGRKRLPTWPGVKHLTPAVSETYQKYALELSRSWGISRVNLDTYLWVEGR